MKELENDSEIPAVPTSTAKPDRLPPTRDAAPAPDATKPHMARVRRQACADPYACDADELDDLEHARRPVVVGRLAGVAPELPVIRLTVRQAE